MGKNAKKQKLKIFGKNSSPSAGSAMRERHMSHIVEWTARFLNTASGETPGKINASGKLIKKPNWDLETITFEPNPDAAVHEIAHVFTMPNKTTLKQYDQIMREQFGYVQSKLGYMKQKRSVFEILPMGVEQKIRRRLGLPASMHGVMVHPSDPPRLELETGRPCANRVKLKNGKTKDLIRCSKNIDGAMLERLERIDNGELKFKPGIGWYECQSSDAKINRRERLRLKKVKQLKIRQTA